MEENTDYIVETADFAENIGPERIKAVVTIIVVAVVNICNVLGYAMDADVWVNAALSILSAASIAYTWWKNQNITPEAVRAQLVLYALKKERKEAKHLAA